MNRALQFQSGCGLLYRCSAGNSLITVDEFGRVMPCRRMPIVCGDVFSSTLEQIYFDHETFRALRREQVPNACLACPYSHSCRGGARCQSYAITGSFYGADPACPMQNKGETI
jgi:radical SAM protein with 4Fe4S-binding SPASM domain